MKLTTAIFFLFICLSLTSFQQDDKGTFSATVDGKVFQLREDQLFRGLVMNKPGSMDGREPAKTVISTTFNGPSYDMSKDRLFNETIQLEINYEADKTGEAAGYAAAMQYESGNYYSIKEQSKMNITQFEWESDKKHFRISADFNCKLRSWGAPADGKKDIALKGKMSNIRVTVPSWITAKN
jgi:hypothetical protein